MVIVLKTQFFDSTGRIVDFRKYDKDGNRIKDRMGMLPWFKEDTVKFGDTVEFSLILGNISDFRYNSGKLIWGHEFNYNDKGRPEYLIDTVGIIESDVNFYPGKN